MTAAVSPSPSQLIPPDDDDPLDTAGCVSVVAALWRQARSDLVDGCPKARLWLNSPAFDYWCMVSLPTKDPAVIREALVSEAATPEDQRPPKRRYHRGG